MIWRRLAILALLAAIPCLGQSAAPLSASSGTLAERTLNATQSGLYYLPTNPPTLTTVTATALATPGSITVTPVLSKVGAITTVAGAALVDGDYFTVEYGPGLTVPIEFDLSPGDGTTGGRVPYVFTAGDSADDIRDGLITLLNGAAAASLTASSGGAATVAIVLDTPGAAGGTNSENVTDGTFAVTGFVNPPAATTVTYRLVAHLADGTSTDAGAASSTAASTATLSAANFLRLTWSAVTNAAYYSVWRTVSPTSPATTGKIVTSTTALTVDDTGLAGDSGTAPAVNGTGLLSGSLRSTSITPVTASKLLGRGSSGAGAAQEITLGTGLTMTGTTLDASGGALSGGTAGRLGIWTAADAMSSHAGLLADATTGALTIGAQSDIVPVTLRAFSSGTSHILQWQNSSNGALGEITHTGGLRLWGLSTNVATDYESYTLATTAGSGIALTAATAGTGADNLGITLTPAGTSPVLVAGDFAFGQAADAYMYARAQIGYAGRHILRQNNPDGNTQLNTYAAAGFISFAFAGVEKARFASNTFGFQLENSLSWGATSSGTQDLYLYRDAAGTLAQRNGVNAQTFRTYGSYTDASNYVRASLSATSTAVTLAAETAGTGADDVPVILTPAGKEAIKTAGPTASGAVFARAIEIDNSASASTQDQVLGAGNVGIYTYMHGSGKNNSGFNAFVYGGAGANIGAVVGGGLGASSGSHAIGILAASSFAAASGNAAGYFTFFNGSIANPTFTTSAVVIANNATQAVPLFTGLDNGVKAFEVEDGGKITTYGTYTDASNYVRASLSATSTAVTLASETAGTGADDVDVNITAAGAGDTRLKIGTADRAVIAGGTVALTESSATPILDVAVASGTVAGGEVLYTIRADDATDFQALTGRVQWSAVNKGGTLTASINLVGTETTAVSAGTLTNTPTITTGTNSITINLNAVSSLTQTTLVAYVQAQNNGTGGATTR